METKGEKLWFLGKEVIMGVCTLSFSPRLVVSLTSQLCFFNTSLCWKLWIFSFELSSLYITTYVPLKCGKIDTQSPLPGRFKTHLAKTSLHLKMTLSMMIEPIALCVLGRRSVIPTSHLQLYRQWCSVNYLFLFFHVLDGLYLYKSVSPMTVM